MTAPDTGNKIGSIVKACRLIMRMNRARPDARKSEELYYKMLDTYFSRILAARENGEFLAAHTADPDEKLAVEDFRMAKEERRSSRQPDPTDFSALFSVPYPALRDYLLDKHLDVAAEANVPVAVHTGYWWDF